MKQQATLSFVAFAEFFGLLLNSPTINAQIVPDRTLPHNSIITIQNNNIIEITGGTSVGGNLFHSFNQFSVLRGETAFFNNGLSIENIFSRVTGNSISFIDGLIKNNGIANLFFLNPNGIVFGTHASLDIGGAFLATTANGINFADSTKFEARSSSQQSSLTVSTPIGFAFNNPGDILIYNQGHPLTNPNLGYFPLASSQLPVGLQVKPGKTLAIIGGNVRLDGGILTAIDGQIKLGAVSSGLLDLNWSNSGIVFNDHRVVNFSDIYLSNKALLNVFGVNPNSIEIRGQNITFENGSLAISQNLGLRSNTGLNIYASDSLNIGGESLNQTFPNSLITETLGIGNGGDIKIETQRLFLKDTGSIITAAYGGALGGNLIINASEKVEIDGSSRFVLQNVNGLLTTAFNQALGGNINLSTQQLSLKDSGSIIAITFSQGRGGNINLSTQQLSVDGDGAIAALTFGQGQGGNINLFTQQLSVTGGGQISVLTFGPAPTGNLRINATEGIKVSGFSLTRSPTTSLLNTDNFPSTIGTFTQSSGNAGNLEIVSKYLTIQEGGNIGSATFGTGQGGNISVNVSDLIEITGVTPAATPSFINSITFGSGNAGDLTVNTSKLKIFEGGVISTTTLASGDAGNITINASDFLEINGFTALTATGIDSSALLATQEIQNVLTFPLLLSGKAGNITINTGQLTVSRGGISVGNEGMGSGGSIQINSPTVGLTQDGFIGAATRSGEGGNIEIASQDIRLFNSQISASAGEMGNGGNININTKFLALLDDSTIAANAVVGQGGNINITATSVFVAPDSFITANSQFGIEGQVQIDTTIFPLDPSRVTLPVVARTPDTLLRETCAAAWQNSLAVEGNGETMLNPGDRPRSYTISELVPLGQALAMVRQTDGSIVFVGCESLPTNPNKR